MKATGPKSGAPALPGTQYWNLGDHSSTIARWQAQMHTRGSFLVGTGYFGPNTLVVVKRIQGQNGLPQTGLLGPVTWKLAWTGKYSDSGAATVTAVATRSSHKVGPVQLGTGLARNAVLVDRRQQLCNRSDSRQQMHRRGSSLIGNRRIRTAHAGGGQDDCNG